MENISENTSITVEMAPMEGITTALFRQLYRKWFGGADREYTPFLVANQTHKFKTREKKEFIPYSDLLVPQIMTDKAGHFLWAMRELKKAGYSEVNLNAGCPSATVTTKKKGAGMLSDLSSLEAFLDEVFEAKEKEALPEVSVKTRVGVFSYDEAADIAKLYAKYPLSKVIVHPRIRDDLYKNTPDMDAFRIFYEKLPHEKLVFNGDLKSPGDVKNVIKTFPDLSAVMLGRGLLADPFLPAKLRQEYSRFSGREPEILTGFLEELYKEYARELSDDNTALLKMKDIWNFMAPAFPDRHKQLKTIMKSRTPLEYASAVRSLLHAHF